MLLLMLMAIIYRQCMYHHFNFRNKNGKNKLTKTYPFITINMKTKHGFCNLKCWVSQILDSI